MALQPSYGAVDVVVAPTSLSGEAIESCRKELTDLVQRRRVRLVLNLQSTNIIDSQGLELLMDIHESCLKKGGQLVLATPSALCAEVLDITGVNLTINTHHDLRSALGSFAQ